MTYSEAIARADSQRPNQMPVSEKVAGLAELESELLELTASDEELQSPTFHQDGSIGEDVDLVLPYPKDNLYVAYLMVLIDQYHQEWDLANNDKVVFLEQHADVKAWWRRSHRGPASGNWVV